MHWPLRCAMLLVTMVTGGPCWGQDIECPPAPLTDVTKDVKVEATAGLLTKFLSSIGASGEDKETVRQVVRADAWGADLIYKLTYLSMQCSSLARDKTLSPETKREKLRAVYRETFVENRPPAPVPSNVASCSDGVKNGAETAVDCGGGCPARMLFQIKACIDGSDDLHIKDKSVWWVHRSWKLPGLHESCTLKETLINGVAWTPVWNGNAPCCKRPDVPCHEPCWSDRRTTLPVSLPKAEGRLIVHKLAGRGNVTPIQQPSDDNGYEGVVMFDDNEQPFSDVYEATISHECN